MQSSTEEHARFLVPEQEVRRRIAELQRILADRGVDLAWISHLTDRHYFSGSGQDGVLLVPAAEDPVFFVRKSLSRARREASVPVEAWPGRKVLLDAARQQLHAGATLGLSADVTPASVYIWLVAGLPEVELVDVASVVRKLRSVKSPWEIEQLRVASAQATTIYEEVSAHLRAGITELELTGSIEGGLRAIGHGGTIRVRAPGSDIAMITAVSGDSGLYPTSFNGPVGAVGPYPLAASGAGWKRIVEGETVMLDMVTSYNGYHGDTTRVFQVGGPPPDAAVRAHDFCLAVLERIEGLLRPGNRCSQVFREVSAWVGAQDEPPGFMGHGENRVKFFGHGVGLELDEMPVLAERIDEEICVGTVLAVEPKAFLPGIGPVGIENTYVVAKDGCESLCSYPSAIGRV